VNDHTRTPIETITAPYGREIRLDEIAYETGMTLMRVTIREGARYTILEIDPATARRWSEALGAWAQKVPPA
jgi:hypothetical protein